MKKTILKATLTSVATTLAIGASVGAAGGNVLTLTATQAQDTGTITYSGTTDASVLAVSCSLRDASGAEVDFGSVAVDTATFSGTFVADVADYTLKCANYDGGTWVTTTIGDVDDADSPETGRVTNEENASASTNILLPTMVTVFLVVIGAVSGTVCVKKRKK